MESLLLGIDLGNHYSQISVYNPKKGEMESISPFPAEDGGLIPTVLGVTEDKKTWVYGRESIKRECVQASNLLERTEAGGSFRIYEVDFPAESILEKYLKKLLLLVKARYPLNSIRKIVLTIEKKTPLVEAAIFSGLKKLGIGRERAALLTYEESYVSYALSQKKELWQNDVGLFDFNERGLYYKRISINWENSPMAVHVIERDETKALSYEMLAKEGQKENLAYIFLNLAEKALYNQSVSTIYVTGEGFMGSFADEALHKLCVGRRVFAGSNLYSQGACYKAMELGGKKKAENYIFMGEGSISCNILLMAYQNGREAPVLLSRFGALWQEADGEVQVILDEEEEVQILINDPFKKENKVLAIPLDGLPMRPNKMTRISIALKFLSPNEFVVTIQDRGFGNFCKASDCVWERRITF